MFYADGAKNEGCNTRWLNPEEDSSKYDPSKLAFSPPTMTAQEADKNKYLYIGPGSNRLKRQRSLNYVSSDNFFAVPITSEENL